MAARRRKRSIKFYTQDDMSEFVWSDYIDARVPVWFTAMIDRLFVNASRRGVPWKCLLSRMVLAAARKDPTLFPHKVLFAYAIGTTLYILIKRPNRSSDNYLSVRYRHNFTKTLRQFDQITKTQFVELFGDKGVEIRLSPVRRQKRAEKRDPGVAHKHREPKPEKRLIGAWRRAKDAHLHIPGTRKSKAAAATATT